MGRRYYITTPIYYVNDSPHIGHSYTTIAADVLARYHRARGRDPYFLTGTDEHGIKICRAAIDQGLAPGELVDRVVVHFRQMWKLLDIRYDDFIRTSQPRHHNRVRALVSRLIERGEIYPDTYDGWYDEGEEAFVTENTARENDYKSKITGRPLARHTEEGYFFGISRWADRLIEHIESHPEFIMPPSRRNEVLSKLKSGVEDLCISRRAEKLLHWGIPMPNDRRYSVYVWIDALSNYITALGYPPEDDGENELYHSCWPADVQLIGKDILWFHAVYWPCLLMALDLPLPVTIFAHGWWTNRGRKMSKSLGNFISREVIIKICRDFSGDYFRYFLLRSVRFGEDGDFSGKKLTGIYDVELANGIGNLLSRTARMIERYLDGVLLSPPPSGSGERGVIDAAEKLIGSASGHMERFEFQAYLNKIVDLETATNRYIEMTKPFQLAGDDSRKERLTQILGTCAEAVRIILLYLRPVMPGKAGEGLKTLGVEADGEGAYLRRVKWGGYTWKRPVRKGEPLFPRKKKVPDYLDSETN